VKVTGKYRGRAERGAALVIAIFTLMLISVVATAMILMAGSETAMKGNYKSSMQAFYDAKAGLEEGRGRLWANHPNSITNPNSATNCVFPAPGVMMPATPTIRVCYIVNPSGNEVVNPLDLSATNPYADTEFRQEWGVPVTDGSVNVQQPFITSTSAVPGAGIAGPLFKWVRITPRSEVSAKMDVDNDDNATDPSPIFYDGAQQLVSGGAPPPNAVQVLTVTALAVTPYGSRRMVQYTVAPSAFAAALSTFPSALTLDGNGVSFAGPAGEDGANFLINGNDSDVPPSGIPAIGYTNSNDYSNAASGLSAAAASNKYLSPAGVSNVGLLPPWSLQTPSGLPLTLQTPSGLDAIAQAITANADKVITGPVTISDANNIFPAGMSAMNPMVTVVTGDLTLNAWHNTGYGLLLVTGQLKYDPDTTWDGVILVIGKGVFVSNQNGIGRINGTVFVANTRDAAGNLLQNLGPASFSQTAGGYGIRYSSNFVRSTQALLPYQVLSFREIAQTTP
jgi:hypothetical protein